MSNLAILSEQKQEYVAGRLAGKNRTQAALAAGYAPGTARVANQVIETPEVKAVFRSLVQRSLPMDQLVEVLSKGLTSTETRLAQVDGHFTDERTLPDFAQRRAYLELAAEYAGYVEKDGAALTVQIGSLSVAMPEGDAAMQSAQLAAQPVLDLAPDAALSADVQPADAALPDVLPTAVE